MARRARELLTSDEYLPVVIPGTVVVIRPGNRLQIGSGPDSGIVVELDRDVSARQLADLLVTLERPQRMSDVASELATTGLTPDDLTTLLEHMVAAGRALHGLSSPRRIDERLRRSSVERALRKRAARQAAALAGAAAGHGARKSCCTATVSATRKRGRISSGTS